MNHSHHYLKIIISKSLLFKIMINETSLKKKIKERINMIYKESFFIFFKFKVINAIFKYFF